MLYIILAVGALIAGAVTAIAGGGGILIVTLLMLFDTPIKMVIGTNRLSALMDNATSTYNYNKRGKINRKFLKYSMLPALVGTFIGSKFFINGGFVCAGAAYSCYTNSFGRALKLFKKDGYGKQVSGIHTKKTSCSGCLLHLL